jgi:hypothetical protein
MKRIATVILLTLPGIVLPQVVNIARTSTSSRGHESIRVPRNGVVSVSLPSGQRAFIKFYSITYGRAEYSWKYQRRPGADIELGTGTVVEKYEQLPPVEGHGHEVLPLPGHDVIIRAGDIRAEWSSGGDDYGYFYFNPKVASASLAPAAKFDEL